MRLTLTMLGGVAALSCATSVSAAFTGWSHELVTLGNGHVIMNIYAEFNDQGDRLLNVVHGTITTNAAGGFYQSASNPFWKPSGSQNKLTSDDSWVTIDTNSNGNAYSGTMGDQNFWNFDDSSSAASDFSVLTSYTSGVGWYNGNPGSGSYGYANGGKVLVAHFVATGLNGFPPDRFVSWSAECIVQQAVGGTVFGQGAGTFIIPWGVPGPSALAVVAISGLATRRRRG